MIYPKGVTSVLSKGVTAGRVPTWAPRGSSLQGANRGSRGAQSTFGETGRAQAPGLCGHWASLPGGEPLRGGGSMLRRWTRPALTASTQLGSWSWGHGACRRQAAVSALPQKSPVSHGPPVPWRRGSEPGPQQDDDTSGECQHWARPDAVCGGHPPAGRPRLPARGEEGGQKGLPRPAPPIPRPFCCFCCCRPPRPRPLATTSSLTMSMISSGMRRYLMVLPRM